MPPIPRTPLTVAICYRSILRAFKNTSLAETKAKDQWKEHVRKYFEQGIPGRSKEEALTIGFEYAKSHTSLTYLKDLYKRYNITKLKKIDAGKAAARVGLQLPNVNPHKAN